MPQAGRKRLREYLVSDARGPDSMAVLLNPLDWVREIWRLYSQPSLYRNRSPGDELETHHRKQRVLRVLQGVAWILLYM